MILRNKFDHPNMNNIHLASQFWASYARHIYLSHYLSLIFFISLFFLCIFHSHYRSFSKHLCRSLFHRLYILITFFINNDNSFWYLRLYIKLQKNRNSQIYLVQILKYQMLVIFFPLSLSVFLSIFLSFSLSLWQEI